MWKFFNIFNRPISPHLTIYSPQFFSLFSIWHRITSLCLLVGIFSALVLFKSFLFTFNFSIIIFVPLFKEFTLTFLFFSFLTFFLYHSLNGIRHIIWDIGYLLKLNSLYFSAFFSIFGILLTLVLNLLNF